VAPSYAPPKPILTLRGIVWADSARALVEGFPGTQAMRAVRTGDVVGGLRIAGIGRRSVRVIGMDTTWLLTLQRTRP
jgi:hypothetical protein